MSDFLSNLTDVDALRSLLDARKKGNARPIDEKEMVKHIQSRVRGQDHVATDMARYIRLQWGKEKRGKPVACILMLGPTGTGKTEMAKAMAEYLFDDEKNMLRFDCSEFTGAESKNRLIGMPTGYVGADSGGQLTRPMLNNPRRLVLFDEVEKAWPGIFDLFLSMMGDGRLTEQGSGRTADFTQAVIVLTSNLEYEAIGKIQSQIDDPHEQIDAIKKHLRDCKAFRPEILGRFDKVYVFKPLETIVMAEIAALKMVKLAAEYGLKLERVDPRLIVDTIDKSEKVKEFGVRELDRVVGELLGEPLLAAKDSGATRVKISIDDDGDLSIEPAD